MNLPEWFVRFANWLEKHPYKTMFYVQIPICAMVALLTIKLAK